MKQLNPQIGLEQELNRQIYEALQGSVVEEVLRQVRTDASDSYWRSTLEGHSFKVERSLLGHLYDLFYEVKARLGYDEKVDFYITGDASVNAFSVAAEGEGAPHIVNINSALVELMSDDELRFVIGHELGHLMNRNTALLRLIHFVFPPQSNMPIALQHKIKLWQQLSELVADRYGYMAVGSLPVCVSAFFKMASGLNLMKMNVSIDALVEENIKHLDYFLNDKGLSRADHPVNPIRVQALNLFATCETDEELEKRMEELIGILLKVGNEEIDQHMMMFVATAGLIVSSVDEEISKDEVNTILDHLAGYHIFPKSLLDAVAASEKVSDMFVESVQHIMELDPSMREGMMGYVIRLILSDKDIKGKEVELLYNLGENVFGYTRKEIANLFGKYIQIGYVPSHELMYR